MGTSREDLEPGTGRNALSPGQIAAVIGGALLLLLLVWFFFLRADGDDQIEDPAASAPPVAEEAPEDEPENEETGDSGNRRPVETFEVFAPKDPFDPLISASTGGDAAGGDGATTDGSTTAPDGASPTDGTGTTTTTTTGGRGRADAGQDVAGHRVQVIDVYRDGGSASAQIQVDGTVYTVQEGDRFAQNFQLMSTSGRCASVLYGDDQFTLCEGEEILK